MSTRNFWGLSGKLSPHSGSIALKELNHIHKKATEVYLEPIQTFMIFHILFLRKN